MKKIRIGINFILSILVHLVYWCYIPIHVLIIKPFRYMIDTAIVNSMHDRGRKIMHVRYIWNRIHFKSSFTWK